MNLATYPLNQGINELEFFFVSADSKGENRVIKIIKYELIDKHKAVYYNLGFGDLDIETGKVDDEAVTNNGDMRKVFSTVVSTLPYFFKMYPTSKVHLDGSTLVRKQYYHKLVRDYFKQIQEHYLIEGCSNEKVEVFDHSREYDFILISLR